MALTALFVSTTSTMRRSITFSERFTKPLRSRRVTAFVAAAELTPKVDAICPVFAHLKLEGAGTIRLPGLFGFLDVSLDSR